MVSATRAAKENRVLGEEKKTRKGKTRKSETGGKRRKRRQVKRTKGEEDRRREEKKRDDTEDARTRNRNAAKLRFLNPLPQNTASQRFGILE